MTLPTETDIGEFAREFLFTIVLGGSGSSVEIALKLVETQFLPSMSYPEFTHLLKTHAGSFESESAAITLFIQLIAKKAPDIAAKFILKYWIQSNIFEPILIQTQEIFPHFTEIVETLYEQLELSGKFTIENCLQVAENEWESYANLIQLQNTALTDIAFFYLQQFKAELGASNVQKTTVTLLSKALKLIRVRLKPGSQ